MTLLDDLKRLDETKRGNGWDRLLDFLLGLILGVLFMAVIMYVMTI